MGGTAWASRDKICVFLGRELRERALGRTTWASRDKKYVEPCVEASKLSLGMEEASGQGQNMGLAGPRVERVVLGENSLGLQGQKTPSTLG